jgi:hypothetical protein
MSGPDERDICYNTLSERFLKAQLVHGTAGAATGTYFHGWIADEAVQRA